MVVLVRLVGFFFSLRAECVAASFGEATLYSGHEQGGPKCLGHMGMDLCKPATTMSSPSCL